MKTLDVALIGFCTKRIDVFGIYLFLIRFEVASSTCHGDPDHRLVLDLIDLSIFDFLIGKLPFIFADCILFFFISLKGFVINN